MENVKISKFKSHPWDLAKEQVLTRTSRVLGTEQGEQIDPGVNFFVQALEALGATTLFSCEGHPTGFYIAFSANYELAKEISQAGFFTVEISDTAPNTWVIRKRGTEANPVNRVKGYTEADKERTLRWAAEAWIKYFDDRIREKTPNQLESFSRTSSF
jgi:hypothetical protein